MPVTDPVKFCTHCQTIQPRATFRRIAIVSKYSRLGHRDVCAGCYDRKQKHRAVA